MKRILNEAWKEAFSPSGSRPGEMMAAGSLIAGIGLFVMSVLMVLAVGFFAGALVLIEKVAQNVMGVGEHQELEVIPVVARRAVRRIELL